MIQGLKVYLVLIACCFISGCVSKLPERSDSDIVESMRSDEYLIVFFSGKNCPECDKYEAVLEKLIDKFDIELDAKLIKAENSQLARLYNPNKEPGIVFFRHGVPLLYHGPANEEDIMEKFSLNSSPVVKELSDENFEHLTQAASGATTGDWLLMFYTQECVQCQRLVAIWEAVGAQFKNIMNVARVNSGSFGIATAKRFQVTKAPEFIFLRQGKFYRYNLNKFDVDSFVSFGKDWYKNVRAEKVPVPSSPFDNVVESVVSFIKSNAGSTNIIRIGVISGLVLIGLAFLVKIFSSKKTVAPKPDKKKKK